jgi:hypothetical protein
VSSNRKPAWSIPWFAVISGPIPASRLNFLNLSNSRKLCSIDEQSSLAKQFS